jgi:hypothetical protein
MLGQVRIYTINEGQMEGWLEQFDQLVPMFARAGITVRASWVELEENRFGWLRTFDDGDMEGSRKRFSELPEWQAVQGKATSFVASLDVTDVDYR